MASLGGPIYAIGGLDDNTCFNDVERYDIESDQWSTVAPMITPRGGVGSVALLVSYMATCPLNCTALHCNQGNVQYMHITSMKILIIYRII